MPNFHTHWLVALQAIESAPDVVKKGRNAWVEAALTFKSRLQDALKNAKSVEKAASAIDHAHVDWLTLMSQANDHYHDMVCFSAYMLGACGPDFWTVPSGKAVSTAGKHFDLGHYNRTHRQFEVSLGEVGGRSDLQAMVEQAYFSGMATHIAGDLVIHQLVNVSAGAYNLLKKPWGNEHGLLSNPHGWSTHNKVEHYWDTYVRHCWLGDYGPLWPDD